MSNAIPQCPAARKMYHEMNTEEREAYHAHVREQARKCGIIHDETATRYLSEYYARPNQYSGD